jgi:SulP family sulfate permease
MGAARFGKLINFVSYSVITGYTAGVGVLIAFGQFKNLLGLSLPNYRHFVETVFHTFHYSLDANIVSVILGVFTIVFILFSKKLSPKLPAAFLAIILSAFAVRLFHLDYYGVKLVGDIPRSLPPFSTFPFSYEAIRSLFIPALAIALLTAVEALSIAKSISHSSGEKIDSSREFLAQGLANISAAFSSSMPGSGSFTRSAINFSAGAGSRFAGAFSGIFVLIIILTFAPYAKYIPMSSLAGILIVFAYLLVNKKGLWLSFKSTRADRWVLYVTIASTLLLDLDKAVYIGVLLSIILYLRYVSRPPVVKMVPRVPDGKLVPYKEGLLDCSEVSIYQIEGSLFFGAIEELEERLASIDYQSTQAIILRMKQVGLIDATAIHALDKFLRDCEQRNIKVIFAGVRPGVLKAFTRSKLLDQIGSSNIVEDTNVAVKLAYAKYVTLERCLTCKHHTFAECKKMVLSS